MHPFQNQNTWRTISARSKGPPQQVCIMAGRCRGASQTDMRLKIKRHVPHAPPLHHPCRDLARALLPLAQASMGHTALMQVRPSPCALQVYAVTQDLSKNIWHAHIMTFYVLNTFIQSTPPTLKPHLREMTSNEFKKRESPKNAGSHAGGGGHFGLGIGAGINGGGGLLSGTLPTHKRQSSDASNQGGASSVGMAHSAGGQDASVKPWLSAS